MTTIVARPARVDLNLYAGDDFYIDLTVLNADGTAADLAGVTARADIRQNTGLPVLASFGVSIAGNVVSLELEGSDVALLPDSAVWDCQLTGIKSWTCAAGTVRTNQQITV